MLKDSSIMSRKDLHLYFIFLYFKPNLKLLFEELLTFLNLGMQLNLGYKTIFVCKAKVLLITL